MRKGISADEGLQTAAGAEREAAIHHLDATQPHASS